MTPSAQAHAKWSDSPRVRRPQDGGDHFVKPGETTNDSKSSECHRGRLTNELVILHARDATAGIGALNRPNECGESSFSRKPLHCGDLGQQADAPVLSSAGGNLEKGELCGEG